MTQSTEDNRKRIILQPRPQQLGEKLLRIRTHFGLRQLDIVSLVCPWLDDEARSVISLYERGEREPPLITLLLYARLAEVSVETLIDDEIPLIIPIPKKKISRP